MIRTKVVRDQIEAYGSPSAVITAALALLANDMRRGVNLSSPAAVRDFLRLTLAGLEFEAFWCVWLDAQNRVIAAEESFRGTLTQTSVFPREIVRRALQLNAAGVIFAHNHPSSGVAEPSHADETLTRTLKECLSMVDTRVLDHFIIGSGRSMSFAERGLL